MHLLAPTDDGEDRLRAAIHRLLPGIQLVEPSPGLLGLKGNLNLQQPLPHLPFASQLLPQVTPLRAQSIRDWADQITPLITSGVPPERSWRLHVVPHYGERNAGANRCRWITEAIIDRLRQHRRSTLRQLRHSHPPFQEDDSIVQVWLTQPDAAWCSVTPPPIPRLQSHLLSPFPRGEIPPAVDKSAPSRAFAKLVEAEQRLGIPIHAGDTCVDLGASPGSWTYVALQRGATVTAVDRSPLREDLHRHPRFTFIQGDAFAYTPPTPVDWLLCDVIAAPERSIDLLERWLQERHARRFVLTVKFKGREADDVLDRLPGRLARFTATLHLRHLTANRNEVCAFGCASGESAPP